MTLAGPPAFSSYSPGYSPGYSLNGHAAYTSVNKCIHKQEVPGILKIVQNPRNSQRNCCRSLSSFFPIVRYPQHPEFPDEFPPDEFPLIIYFLAIFFRVPNRKFFPGPYTCIWPFLPPPTHMPHTLCPPPPHTHTRTCPPTLCTPPPHPPPRPPHMILVHAL